MNRKANRKNTRKSRRMNRKSRRATRRMQRKSRRNMYGGFFFQTAPAPSYPPGTRVFNSPAPEQSTTTVSGPAQSTVGTYGGPSKEGSSTDTVSAPKEHTRAPPPAGRRGGPMVNRASSGM